MIVRILPVLALLASLTLAPLYPGQVSAHTDTAIPSTISQNNWNVSWVTNDYGLVVTNVQYKGATDPYSTIISEARLSNVYVDYPNPPGGDDLIDDFQDYLFLKHLHKVNVANGFHLDATYFIGCEENEWPDAGCYKYIQEWWFFSDGSFRPWLQILGPGFTYSDSNCLACDWGDPEYESRFRINTGVTGSADDGVKYWISSWSFSGLYLEGSKSDVAPGDPDGNEFKVFDYPETGSGTDEAVLIDPFTPDEAKWWSLRHYSSQYRIPTCIPGGQPYCDNPISGVRGSPRYWDNDEPLQTPPPPLPGSGQDNVHWYISQSSWDGGACSPVNTCYPGGEWQAKFFS